MNGAPCVYCKGWAVPAVVAYYADVGSGPGGAALAHEDCHNTRGRKWNDVPPPLPRRVRRDLIRRTIDEQPPDPELLAVVRASLPQVSVPVREQLQPAGRVLRPMAGERGGGQPVVNRRKLPARRSFLRRHIGAVVVLVVFYLPPAVYVIAALARLA